MNIRRYHSPCGTLIIGSEGGSICLCDWESHYDLTSTALTDLLSTKFRTKVIEGITPIIQEAENQLNEYFSGNRKQFDLPILMTGTEFQRKVWETLLTIPYGTTQSYRELAYRMGKPRSVRAIANAVGANMLSIIIPCHRVIGADKSLTGYRGGLPAKHHLLTLEYNEQIF